MNNKELESKISSAISPLALKILETFSKNNTESYLVGGFVRDCLLSRKTSDIDIAAKSTPQQTKALFEKKFTVIDTGIKYGTVTVIDPDESAQQCEVTAFRSESGYFDSRHPSDVSFSANLKDDLSRRDFTVNALAYNKNSGLVDLFGGLKDLSAKIIRCVGDPDTRFAEDALRMLRAVRFSSKLIFDIEPETLNSIRKNAALIKNVSAERITKELNLMLLEEKPSAAFFLMQKTGLLKHILPEIDIMTGFDQKNPAHPYDLLTHTLKTIDNSEPLLPVRLACLLHDTGKIHTFTIDENGAGHFYGHEKISAKITENVLKRLKYPAKTVKLVTELVSRHQINPYAITDKGIRRIIAAISEKPALMLANLQYADSSATLLKDNMLFTNKLKALLAKEQRLTVKKLAVNGYDMMDLDFEGKEIGSVLNKLLEYVLENPENNSREKLIEKAKSYRHNN